MAITAENYHDTVADLAEKILGGRVAANYRQGIDDINQEAELKTQNADIIDRILGESAAQQESNNQFVDTQVVPELEKARALNSDVGYIDRLALQKQDATRNKTQDAYSDVARQAAEAALKYNQQQQDIQNKLSGTYAGLNASDLAANQQYQTETNPLMQALQARGYGPDVLADAEGLGAQRDVMQRYKDLSSPEMTAQERYLGEIARRNFESQDRSNREAVMQDLSQRGLQSGTLQIANNLAAQERLGQDRTLAELGMQANAVGRSMQALQGYGGQANALRSANDAINMFNKEQSQVTQRFQDQYAADEAKRVGELAGKRMQGTIDTNKGIGVRASDESLQGQSATRDQSYRDREGRDAQQAAADVQYKTDTDYNNAYRDIGTNDWTRQMGLLGAAGNTAGVRSGTSFGGGQTQLQALKLALGANEGERALIASRMI